MRDITELMDHYRVVARSLWNTGFWPVQNLRAWDTSDQYEQIKALLFKALVVAQLEEGHCCDLYGLPERKLNVVPTAPGGVPIMIHKPRDGDRNWYWDDPVCEIKPDDAELTFLDYFDWDVMNYRDLQYLRVRITKFEGQPHLVGRDALLEHAHARVFAV